MSLIAKIVKDYVSNWYSIHKNVWKLTFISIIKLGVYNKYWCLKSFCNFWYTKCILKWMMIYLHWRCFSQKFVGQNNLHIELSLQLIFLRKKICNNYIHWFDLYTSTDKNGVIIFPHDWLDMYTKIDQKRVVILNSSWFDLNTGTDITGPCFTININYSIMQKPWSAPHDW
jgi:hypothetical protein